MKLNPELKPDNWDEFTSEEKKEFLSLTEEEQAFFKILDLDKPKPKNKQKKS